MNAVLFYNRKIIGDVLFLVIDPEAIPTRVEKHDNVVALYKEEKLIGVNILEFSEIVKIKGEGLLILPPRQLVDIVNHILKNTGIEPIAYIESSGFRIGHVLACEAHPDSDHLHVCKVDVGSAVLDIVCGAANVKKGQKVVVAMPYTTMFDGSRIIPSALRGVKSEGMICSSRELHLEAPEGSHGIMTLKDDAPIGEDFFLYKGE
ncbi:MAG: DUF4479 domain-containing protein [Firmicutes bacterium]|nr:DUF4479 domain-containing protein [Bacillota bacterium]